MKQHLTPAYLLAALWLAIGVSLATIVSLLLVPVEFTDVRGAVVYSTTPRLRLREAPVVDVDDTSNVIAKLDPAHPLLVLGEEENAFGWWLRVRDQVTGREGWSAASYLRATPTVHTVSRTAPLATLVAARAGDRLVVIQLFVRRASGELQVLLAVVGIVLSVIALRRKPQVVFVESPRSSPAAPPPLPNAEPTQGSSRSRHNHYVGNVSIPRKK